MQTLSQTIFQLTNIVVVPFWFLLIILPWWDWTQRIVSSPFIAALPALIYSVLVIPRLPSLLGPVTSGNLDDIRTLLGTTDGTVIVWAHLLAFDLLAGRWIYLDSHERNISAWLVSPILVFTFLFGPLGFTLYLIVRTIDEARRRSTTASGAA